MELNLAQLKDLEHICWLASTCYEKTYGLPEEIKWLERIKIYRAMFQAEITRGKVERADRSLQQ